MLRHEFFKYIAPPFIFALLLEKEQLIINKVELFRLIAPPFKEAILLEKWQLIMVQQ